MESELTFLHQDSYVKLFLGLFFFFLWPVPIYPGADHLHYLHRSSINAKETLPKP